MALTCLDFTGVIAEDGTDTQELSVGPSAPVLGQADADLSGAPAGSVKVSEFDLTVTATADMAGSPPALAVAVSDEASLNPLPGGNDASGTWTGGISGALNTYRTSPVDAWYSNNFSTWLTEYLDIDGTTSASSFTITQPSSSVYTPTEIDIRFRVRRADWSTPYGTRGGTIATAVGNLAWELRANTGSILQFRFRTADASSTDKIAAVNVATIGLSNGAWGWGRVTYNQANGVRWWSSSDGASWTNVETDTFVGATTMISGTGFLRIGNGNAASATAGSAFGGDIAFLEIRNGVGGSVITDLNLAAMSDSSDLTWDSTTAITNTRTSTIAVIANGGFIGTRTFNFVFDTPTALADFRVYIEALHGAVSVDEWCLTYAPQGGWRLGRL